MRNAVTHHRFLSLPRFVVSGLCAVILTFLGSASNLWAAQQTRPFCPGEKLTFQIKWGFIPAGEAVLEVLPVETLNGTKTYHFVLMVSTNSVVDVFYKVRNRIDAYADIDMTHSILFKEKKREGKTRRDVVITFDWEKNEARYANFGRKNKPISIYPGAFDPLSVFYYVRHLDLKVNSKISRPVTDGKKSKIGNAAIIKREQIKVAGKTYDAFLFEPELKHVGGVFEKSRNAKIKLWISADHRKIPLKIKSKVIVGSFIGELISAEGLAD